MIRIEVVTWSRITVVIPQIPSNHDWYSTDFIYRLCMQCCVCQNPRWNYICSKSTREAKIKMNCIIFLERYLGQIIVIYRNKTNFIFSKQLYVFYLDILSFELIQFPEWCLFTSAITTDQCKHKIPPRWQVNCAFHFGNKWMFFTVD